MTLILAIIGGIAGAIYMASHFLGAARDGKDAVDEIKGAVRRGKWSKQIDSRLIENIDDPREVAAILMVQAASYEGEITIAQKDRMIALMQQNFGVSSDEAEGFYSFGRMAIGQINDAANSLSKLLRPVKDSLTQEEMGQLIAMLEDVTEIEGSASDRQRDLIMQVRRGLITHH